MKRNLMIILALVLTASLRAQTNDSLPRLSVQDCVELALKNNLPLQNARLQMDEAQAVKNAARAEYFPTVMAQALAFDAKNPLINFGIDDIDNALVRQTLRNIISEYGYMWGYDDEISYFRNGTVANIMATEPIYAGGRIRNGNRLAKLGIEAAGLQTKIKEDEVRQQTECLYWEIVSLQEKISTLDELDRLLDTLSKYAKGAIDAGLTLPNDLYKISIKQNESRLNRKKAEDGITLLKMVLTQYIGLGTEDLMLTDTLSVETAPLTSCCNVSEAVGKRNEAQLLDLSVQAEKLKKKMSLGEALPSLMVGGSVNYNTVFEHPKPNALVFAMLQIPITDWYKTSCKLKKHDIETEMAQNQQRDLTEQMELQTKQAWFELQQSWLRIELARASTDEAEANLKMANDYYEAGISALSEVLEAQTLLKQSRDELTDSRIEYRINLLKYSFLDPLSSLTPTR